MHTLHKLSLALVGTAIVLMSVKPANAFTLTRGGVNNNDGQGLVSGVSGATTINFNDGKASTPDGFATFTTAGSAPTIVQGNVGGQYASPADDTSPYLAISPGLNNGAVTLNFAKALDSFGFYWGSVDTYNFVDLYKGDRLLTTFSGSDVPGTTASGNQASPEDNVFVSFFADNNDEVFDKVVMRSTAPAFETDNYAYRQAVPESNAMLGLLAFGALGAPSILKRKQKQIA